MIAETRCFKVGRFTVQQRPRFDSPAWAVYVIFLGERLIGKNFSLPSESDCLWLQSNGGVYATVSRWSETSAKHRIPGRGRARAAREFLEALEP